MINNLSNENSFVLKEFVVFLTGILFVFVFAFASIGFLYVSTSGRYEYSSLGYMNYFQPSVTKLNTKDFNDSEIEIFRLILRHANSLNPSEAYNLATVISNESYKKGIAPSIVLGVIMVESRFRPKAVSNKGAMGLMQLMPSTGRYIAEQEGIEFFNRQQLYDPEINVRLGIAYLSELEEKYNSINHALGAYNYGPNKFNSLIKRSENANLVPRYVSKVLKFKNSFEDELNNLRES